MLEPVTLWLGFVIGHTAAVTHQNRLVTLPGGFQTEVVIHATVSQNCRGRVGLYLKITLGSRVEVRRVQRQLNRREKRRKARRGAHSNSKLQFGVPNQSDAIIPHVRLA